MDWKIFHNSHLWGARGTRQRGHTHEHACACTQTHIYCPFPPRVCTLTALFILCMRTGSDDVTRQKQGKNSKRREGRQERGRKTKMEWGWIKTPARSAWKQLHLQSEQRVRVHLARVRNCRCVVLGKIEAFKKKGPWLSICAWCLLKEQTMCDDHKVSTVCPNIWCGF